MPGADSFNYTLSDNAGGSSPGTVTVQVNASNVSGIITNLRRQWGRKFYHHRLWFAGQPYDIQAADTVSGPWNTDRSRHRFEQRRGSVTRTLMRRNHASRVYRLAQP